MAISHKFLQLELTLYPCSRRKQQPFNLRRQVKKSHSNLIKSCNNYSPEKKTKNKNHTLTGASYLQTDPHSSSDRRRHGLRSRIQTNPQKSPATGRRCPTTGHRLHWRRPAESGVSRGGTES